MVRRMHFVFSFIQTHTFAYREHRKHPWKRESETNDLENRWAISRRAVYYTSGESCSHTFEKDDEEKMTRHEIQTKWSRQRRRERKRKFTILRLKMFVMQYNPIHWNSWLIDFFKIHVHIFVSTHELKTRNRWIFGFQTSPFSPVRLLTHCFGASLVSFPFFGHISIQEIIRIRGAEQSLNREKNRSNL